MHDFISNMFLKMGYSRGVAVLFASPSLPRQGMPATVVSLFEGEDLHDIALYRVLLDQRGS